MRVRIVINNEPRWLKQHRARQRAQARAEPPRTPTPPASGLAAIATRIGGWTMAAGGAILRLACSLRGHDYVMRLQPRHLALHCPVCGHTTKGWQLDEAEPVATREAPDRFLELVRRRS